MTWTTMADALPERVLSEDDTTHVERALDAAAKWAAGEMPFNLAATAGMATAPSGYASPAWTRHLAVRTTPTTDPRRADLLRLIDAALAMRGKVLTDFGLFTANEIRDSDQQVAAANVQGRA